MISDGAPSSSPRGRTVWDLLRMPPLTEQPWDGTSCVWTLHQLPDFEVLRAALRQIAALRDRTGAAV
jgi:tRNA (cmo5U34)-methyltransferase